MVHVEITDASFTYSEQKTPALEDISMKIKEGSFTLLCGPSGCGKTTLLRCMKQEVRPEGHFTGKIMHGGREIEGADIGIVFQDTDHQCVMRSVLQELVFGMENKGVPLNMMHRRLAELVQLFDVEALLDRTVEQLSGGEKQLVNILSVVLMEPSILLLDEPMAQLDPIATQHLLHILVILNQEFNMTIVLAEHRIDELIPLVDQIVFLQKGRIVQDGNPQDVCKWLWERKELHPFLPVIPKVVLSKEEDISILPLSVKEGRTWMKGRQIDLHPIGYTGDRKRNRIQEKIPPLVKLQEVFYRYLYKQKDVLQRLSLGIPEGEILTIHGRNGCGKSTLLQLLAGHIVPQRGKVNWRKDITCALLPQNPKALFSHQRYSEQIDKEQSISGITDGEIHDILHELSTHSFLQEYPYDLSGGELQRVALTLLLCRKPSLLLLDEPTKGLDPLAKEQLYVFIQRFVSQGNTVVLVTHDMEFSQKISDRCALLFQGEVTVIDPPDQFFEASFLYKPIRSRLLQGYKSYQ